MVGNECLDSCTDLAAFDLGFRAFDDGIDWDDPDGVIITTTNNALARSMLPWNPYRKEIFDFKILDGEVVPNGGSFHGFSPMPMYIPHETNIGEGVESNHPD